MSTRSPADRLQPASSQRPIAWYFEPEIFARELL